MGDSFPLKTQIFFQERKKVKIRETLKWTVLAVITIFFAYLGKIHFQHRFTGLFALIVLGAVSAMLFIFYFLGEKES
jgi:hypothetical protein